MFLKKLKIDPPYNPAIPLLGLQLKECKSGTIKTLAHQFITVLFTIPKLWK
jgi:hypothetical protein